MKHENNLVTVHFPNGLSRRRNCRSTELPNDRLTFDARFPATADVFIRRKNVLAVTNRFMRTIGSEPVTYGQFYWRSLFSFLFKVVIVIAIILLIIAQ